MLIADISMDLPLDDLPNSHQSLLTVGAEHARDVHALCSDVAAMIFPSAINPPTEAMLSAVTGKLMTLIADIEASLKGGEADWGSSPTSWPLLARSGFLRDPDLIDVMLARTAEDRLEAKIDSTGGLLPVRLLDHADPNIADAAQILLAADSLHRRVKGMSYRALRPELLHQTCWRVVAAIEVSEGGRTAGIVERARSMLAEYDEGQTVQAAAKKAVHFLGAEWHAELSDPARAGMHLHVASLASRLDIEHDHVVRLLDSHSIAPMALILRAADVEPELAMANIYLFRSFTLTPRDISLFENGYMKVEVAEAKAEIARWALARSRYLMFPAQTAAK